ncbi:MAG: glycosyltransferase [Rhodobacteraceae bacterium]|nr:glycosyltransferase [Paracoccaceae bacterium]
MTDGPLFHLQFGRDGGTERSFLRLAEAFAARGVVQEFAIRPGNSWRSTLDQLGPVHEGWFLRRTPLGLWQAARLRRRIMASGAQAVMAWRAPAARLIPALPTAAKITILGDYPRHLRHFGYLDCLVGVSPPVLEHCRCLGWEGPMRLIPNFLPETFAPIPVNRAAFDTPRNAFLIIGVGRFVRIKGFDTLIHAAAACPDAWLWLVGDGEERAALERLVAALGMAARTRFVGWVNRPQDYIAAADVFAMPSRQEPLGNVVLEAWAAGVPVISTRSEGPDWFATDGVDCLLVDIDDSTAMAAAITRLRTAPDMAAQLVKGGRATMAARFTQDAVVNRYLEIFDRQF